MIATHLTATAVKGHNFNTALSPLVAVIGANYSGKTAFLDSIRLALMGEIPGAKRAVDIFAMSSAARMSVALDFSDGDSIKRAWWKEGASIRSDAQDRPEFTTPLLNAGEYFALTPGKRLQYIAARVALQSTAGAKEIMAELHQKLTEAEISWSDKSVNPMLASIEERLLKEGVQEALNAMLEKTAKPNGYNLLSEHTYFNARVKDTIGAVRTLSELKNREGECSAETLDSIRAEVKRLQDVLAAHNERYGALKQVKESNEKGAARKAQIEQWLALPKGLSSQKALALKMEMAPKNRLIATTDLAGKSSGELHNELASANWKVTSTQDKIDQLKAEIDQHQKDLADISEKEHCPYCKSKSKGWKARIESELKEEVAKFEARILEHKKELEAAQEEAARITNVRSKRLEDETVAANAQKEIDRLNREIQNAEQIGAEEKRNVEQFTAELANLNATPFDAEEYAQVADNIRGTMDAIGNMNKHLDTATQLQQDIRRATEAQEEHQAAATALAAVKLAGAFLREKQQASTNALITSLLDTVNFFTDGILRAPLALHDDEIGYFLPNGRFVTHETFSGLEKMLTYIAMGAALSSKGKLRIALPDEMGVLSSGMRIDVMQRFGQAVEKGILDQVVLAIPMDDVAQHVIPEGWQTIKMEPC